MDINKLETDFRITLQSNTDAIFSMALIDLLEPKNMIQLLETYTPLLKARGNEAAAAYFVSWFSSVPLALQYSISANKAVRLTLANLTVQIFPVGEYHQFSFKITDYETQDAPIAEAERKEWRNQILAEFYTEATKPLFERLAIESNMDIGQIWGQLPTKFNYYLANWLEELENEGLKANLANDYHALAHELKADVFGRKKNPFDVQIRWVEDIRNPGKQMRMKNACCLYYQVGTGEYCYTCPRLKEEDRAEKRAQYLVK
ncbi:(2Fe-2S)-binding protein [Paenibacillus psychroresistens]|uniref:(2Fe-2S)-binding protein n=1 Tax=Paenibacillus psychroresistens TaxID=1778678 RepID=A0A6B8RSG1_9BACL|nr:(2Fe-2S)-binding protein [Paenibacillus psychroresistens]QGQ98847.1 (2Fe-2S)-binding protein [Paenibacillus psychroresistens]